MPEKSKGWKHMNLPVLFGTKSFTKNQAEISQDYKEFSK